MCVSCQLLVLVTFVINFMTCRTDSYELVNAVNSEITNINIVYPVMEGRGVLPVPEIPKDDFLLFLFSISSSTTSFT